MNARSKAMRQGPVKMADIARIACVSPSTVSRALSGSPKIPKETRDAIEAIAVEHGYVINRSARNLRQSLTRTIGVAVPLGHESEQLVSDPFFLQLFGHIADAITARRHDTLLIREPSPDQQWMQRLIRSQRADGYIIVGQSDQHDAINLAAEHFMPIVVGGGEIPGQLYCSVGSDNFEGGRLATGHLIRTGRRNILFVGPANLPQIDRRLAGYEAALAAHGVDVNRALILQTNFAGASVYGAVRSALASGPRFDGIFAASDGIALACVSAIEAAGLSCPGDVAVVGFDDMEAAARSHPTLSTIRQDIPRVGSSLVDLLFQRMDGVDAGSVVVPVELVVRQSAPFTDTATF